MESKIDNRNINILIVDDNTEFRENVRDIVELRGFGVVTAADGIEAVKKTKETRPDLIIMDIRMPKMDGVAAFRQIKEISPETPVILVTAYAGDNVIEGALREGVFGLLMNSLILSITLLPESVLSWSLMIIKTSPRISRTCSMAKVM